MVENWLITEGCGFYRISKAKRMLGYEPAHDFGFWIKNNFSVFQLAKGGLDESL